MSLFQYQGQEEDHYTNVLMNILTLNNCHMMAGFLKGLIPEEAYDFEFHNLIVEFRKKYCPQKMKEYEYVIGIAPYKSAIDNRNEYEDNSGSIPDAWICGENFNLLFEFKIRGVLDESQIVAHQKLLTDCKKVIRLSWTDVIKALKQVYKEADTLERFVIAEFLHVTKNFKSKRSSSGMPTEKTGGINKQDSFHFVVTGSRKVRPYVVESVFEGKRTIINDNLPGLQDARRWIAEYVFIHKDTLPINYMGLETEISDYCVAPGRDEKKNEWNQRKIGSYLSS